MKSTKNTTPELLKGIKFPVMMAYKDDSFVVLFESKNEGTVVWSECTGYEIGYHGCRWSNVDNVHMSDWKPFNGSITLEN